MAKDSPQSGQEAKAGPITFVLVAAILSGIWFAQSPLKTFRQGETPQELLPEKEDVQARLWEDPFLAVQKHEQMEEEEKAQDQVSSIHHSFPYFIDQTKKKVSQKKKTITILINMVDGGPYAEARESRIRHRYAVVSGLGVQNYVPEDSQKIGFFRFPLKREMEDCNLITVAPKRKCLVVPDDPSLKTEDARKIKYEKKTKDCDLIAGTLKGKCLVVPYEWYETDPFVRLSNDDSNENESILVLWIKDEALHHETPLHDLENLIAELTRGLSEVPTDKQLNFKVIGPRTTTTLKSMVKEVKELEKISPDEKKGLLADLKGVQFFSPWSTAPEWLLTQPDPKRSIKSLFREGKEDKFFRTIGTDNQLVEVLIQELCRRGVEAGREDVPITLISEWDTAYGRALPLTFAAIVAQIKEEYGSICRTHNFPYGNSDRNPDLRKKVEELKANPEKLAQLGIKQYSYLRGLDGELSQKISSRTSNSSKESNSLQGLSVKGREISPDIERPEGAMQIDYVRRLTEGEMGKSGTSVKAIGVLGSDVYDKLLILQALRSRFPNALFFTTDLDARFLHPSQKGWTRNLLVASHYGLELHKNLQGMVAPFREGYQTAVFRSVLQALCPPTQNSLCNFPKEYGEKEPRFFEIGMTMPVDLSEPDGNNVHPDPLQPFSVKWIKLACLLVIALLLIGRFIVAGFLEERTWWTMAIYFVVFGFFMWLFSDLSSSNESLDWKGEPFYWFEGVSIWPSQLLRLTGAFLCICFFFRIYWGLDEKKNFETSKTIRKPEDTRWKELKAKYEERIPRWGRVGFSAVLYIGFAFLLMTLINSPENENLYRAQVDDTWQRCAAVKGPLFVAVVLLIALIWQVIEHTLECCHFVRNSIGPSSELSSVRCSIFEVAHRTEKVGKIIYYPIIALILLAASRSSLFDNWDFPLSLVLIIGINFALMLCCSVFLRVSAENVRKTTLKSLEENLFKFTEEGNDSKIKCHKFVIDEIQNLRSGAFAPLSQHPIFGAILYPFGGLGFLALIEYFII